MYLHLMQAWVTTYVMEKLHENHCAGWRRTPRMWSPARPLSRVCGPAQGGGSAARRTGLASAPLEQALDVGARQRHVGRPAVVALAAVRGRLHRPQQGVHLGEAEAAAGPHAAVAGKARADPLERLAQALRPVDLGQVLRQVLDQPPDLDRAEQGR